MLHTRKHELLQVLATALLLSCSDAEPESAAPARGELGELVGDFTVRLTAQNPATGAAARSSVVGLVKDGRDPEPIAWHATDQSGDCTLFEPEAPFCEPACGGSAACTGDDECTPYPKARSVGSVQLRGLGSSALQMTPISGNYMPDKGVLPYPPCDEGAPVELHADGGDYPAFSLETRCIAPLAFDATLRLVKGQDLELTWSAPGRPDLARVQVKLDISHHGGAKGKIECDASDTGELAIASSLVDQLLDLGVAGFPTIALTRRAQSGDSSEPRKVHLSVLQTVERAVEVPGVVSCTADPQCPAGQKCATNLTCQPR